jgi:putative restriction endonuclease
MIEQEFNAICLFRQENPPIKGTTLKTNSPIVEPVFENLKSLRDKLELKFKNYKGIDLKFEYSKGASNFPNILHTSILPPNQKVSNGIYVVICFDKLGRGALVGCAESKTNPKGLDVIYRKKTSKDQLNIDVDGGKEETRYNNTFANPKEFYSGIHDDSDLLKHIEISIDLVLFKLNLIDGKNIEVRELVSSNILFTTFEPNNIHDGREKIAREIIARRGQKKFRNSLLESYNFQCAISKCKIQPILEAAHILPYKGADTNHVQNGILLRADLHTLFDLNLLSIDPKSYTIAIDDSLKDSEYYLYHGQALEVPRKIELQPSKEALLLRKHAV